MHKAHTRRCPQIFCLDWMNAGTTGKTLSDAILFFFGDVILIVEIQLYKVISEEEKVSKLRKIYIKKILSLFFQLSFRLYRMLPYPAVVIWCNVRVVWGALV